MSTPETLPEPEFAILYDDPDHKPEYFRGDGAQEAAEKTLADRNLKWSCYLFRKTEPLADSAIRELHERLTETLPTIIEAAKKADWQQVVLNGGPPCFHLEETGRFCLRAQRWAGHANKTGYPYHKFVPLEDICTRLAEVEKELADAHIACRLARHALDSLMGDSDLDSDNSPEMKACQALAKVLKETKT